jgi:hypothetical protein
MGGSRIRRILHVVAGSLQPPQSDGVVVGNPYVAKARTSLCRCYFPDLQKFLWESGVRRAPMSLSHRWTSKFAIHPDRPRAAANGASRAGIGQDDVSQ